MFHTEGVCIRYPKIKGDRTLRIRRPIQGQRSANTTLFFLPFRNDCPFCDTSHLLH